MGYCRNLRERMQKAQKPRWNVLGGVQVAGLKGHRSRSAVCLVHLISQKRVTGRRLTDGDDMNPPGVYRSKRKCYHRRSVNVL
jgi:hypothetical protein